VGVFRGICFGVARMEGGRGMEAKDLVGKYMYSERSLHRY